MPALEMLPPLREVIKRYELMAKKSLGQHFLCDLNLTRRIAELAGDLSDCTVFEIGPGPGGLTRSLLHTRAKKIIAIEKDRRCLAALEELVNISENRLEVLMADALEINLADLANAPRAIVANLPYNIATPLLLNWLHHMSDFRSMTLMFQAEVADRLIAKPSNKAYGRLSVITQFCCHVKRVINIPARAFTPPPKVDSSVVHLVPRQQRQHDVPLEKLEMVTAAAFGQRRKMLRSSLQALGGEALLIRARLDPTLRAEDLSVEDFENLVRKL